MKKLILSFAVAALATLGATAQTKFGIKAAMNISNLTGDISDNKSLIGANGGLFADIHVSSMFSVQPEVLYSAEGTKLNGGKITLGYVNVPVMLKYNNPSGFFGELGPQLGILTSAKAKGGGSSVDLKDQLKSINLGLGVGAGFNFTPNVGAGVRYNFGLTNIVDASNSGDLKTSNFSIGFHYIFGQGK